jgi:flagellin
VGLRINTNLAAMNAYRNLQTTDARMSQSLERLSSGYRINRAADDAAGLFVSQALRAQIGGLRVAASNAQDGISVVQTAEGALNDSQSILQRMRDLAVQASNTGSGDTDSRTAAQTELTQLNSELDQIGNGTRFGGATLLDGTFGIQPATASGGQIGAIAAGGINPADTISFTLGGGLADAGTKSISLTNTGGRAYAASGAGAAALQTNLQKDINAVPALTGKITAQASYDSLTQLNQVSFTRTEATVAGVAGDTLLVAPSGAALGAFSATPSQASGTAAVFQVGPENSVNDRIAISIGQVNSSTLHTSGIELVNDPTDAIDTLDAAITTASSSQSDLGAYQNRFQYAIDNVNIGVENLSASVSRIMDTDMAAELVNYAKDQLLTQAGASMLAQANQAPQSVLKLLLPSAA